MNSNIGRKIKDLRTSHNMTLKELSEKTNLSIGFLSQLERGLTTVAIDSLDTIAEQLGVDLTYFIPPQKKHRGTVVLKSYENEFAQIVSNKFIYYNLTSNISNKEMHPRLIEILPMEKKENLTCYFHEGEEFIYVLEGTLTLYIDNQEHELYPGDSAHYKSNLYHNWTNYTSKKVKFLSVSVPNMFKEDENKEVEK